MKRVEARGVSEEVLAAVKGMCAEILASIAAMATLRRTAASSNIGSVLVSGYRTAPHHESVATAD